MEVAQWGPVKEPLHKYVPDGQNQAWLSTHAAEILVTCQEHMQPSYSSVQLPCSCVQRLCSCVQRLFMCAVALLMCVACSWVKHM